jgi:hypothetical protein
MWKRLLTPALPDVLFAALIAWLFALSAKGWGLLLSDSDTGWHIRTGEWILSNGRVPYTDMFSFTRPGEPWFAWEWGADVLFALLHRAGGLPLLAFTASLLLVGAGIFLLRWMLWRGSSLLVAFPVFLLAIGGSTMHYLARPHVFTLVFLLAALWLLDAERRQPEHHPPSRRIWLLVPLTLLWTNLHGGWPALFVFLGLHLAARAYCRHPLLRRDLLLLAACAAATLVNPYGWQLHVHILDYLRSDWIREAVDEFQSPRFRAENLIQFEILLIAGIAAAWGRAGRGAAGLAEAAAVWLWAHMALGAVRHAPLFILAAAPVIASEITLLLETCWQGARKTSLAGIFRDLDGDLRPRFATVSVWSLVLASLVAFANPQRLPSDFPAQLFPVEAVRTLGDSLHGRRVFASDQWGNYLLYRCWPSTRVFIDGRSDFYGPQLGKEYLALANASAGWLEILDKHQIEVALLPARSDLATRLKADSGWQIIHEDTVSSVFARRAANPAATTPATLFSPAALMKAPPSTEGIKENRL